MKSFLLIFTVAISSTLLTGCEPIHQKGRTTASIEGETVCSKGAEKRSLANQKTENGCEVIYTKGGSATSIAKATSDVGHCGRTIEKIKGNLVAAGWTCQ